MFGPQLPFDLGPYRVERRIGAGGFATVFRGVVKGEMGFARPVALKVLHEHIVQDEPGVIAMLADEALLLARMQHTNVVSVQWFGRVELPGGQPVYVMAMEYVDGLPLKDVIEDHADRNERLPLPAALQVAIKVARALGYAHNLRSDDGSPLQLIHRDLKPGNIMVTATGETKLLDFGIAKAEGRLAEKTKTNMLRGSIHYLSPEQVYGDPLDFRSDLFAFGAVLWEVVTGKRLINAASVPVAMRSIGLFDVDEHLAKAGAFPASLQPVLRRLLARKPDDRYGSTGELLQALEDIERATPREARDNDYLGTWIRGALRARSQPTADAAVLPPDVAAETPAEAVEPSGLRTGDESFFKNSEEVAAGGPVGADDATLLAPASRSVERDATQMAPTSRPAAPAPMAPPAQVARDRDATRLVPSEERVPTGRTRLVPTRTRSPLRWALPLLLAAVGLAGVALRWGGQGDERVRGDGGTEPAPPRTSTAEEPRPDPAPAASPPPPSSSPAEPTPAVAAAIPATPPPARATPRPANPAGVATATPAPRLAASPGTGSLRLGADHPFVASIGTQRYQQVQMRRGVDLPVGKHTVRLECLDCPVGVEPVQTVQVEITADQRTTRKVRFGGQP